ncbi:MAG: rod-binding protein [Epsilonproteobacteria bacterium]|nr:rod-binding protein [Campylobacterota bacterium]
MIDTATALGNFEALNSLSVMPNIVKTDDDTKLKEQTDKFEAVFIKEILDVSMKSENSLFPKSPGEDIYKSMYNETLSDQLSGKFGFSELLYNFLKQKG